MKRLIQSRQTIEFESSSTDSVKTIGELSRLRKSEPKGIVELVSTRHIRVRSMRIIESEIRRDACPTLLQRGADDAAFAIAVFAAERFHHAAETAEAVFAQTRPRFRAALRRRPMRSRQSPRPRASLLRDGCKSSRPSPRECARFPEPFCPAGKNAAFRAPCRSAANGAASERRQAPDERIIRKNLARVRSANAPRSRAGKRRRIRATSCRPRR